MKIPEQIIYKGLRRTAFALTDEKPRFNLNAVLLAVEEMKDVVNLAAPHPLTNREFMSHLREAYGVSFGLPATKLMLEIGAVFMKTETELILKSRRVIPKKLIDAGFKIKFETWQEAARDLCRKADSVASLSKIY